MPSDFILQVRLTLERTPERLRSLLSEADPKALVWKPSAEQWSVEEVLAHLVDTETVLLERLQLLLQGKDFEPYDQEARLREISSRVVTPAQLMDQFAVARGENLPVVEKMRDDQLDMTANHAELGPVTMRMLLADWAASDLAHTRQIIKLLIQPFYRELGPWRRYFQNNAFPE